MGKKKEITLESEGYQEMCCVTCGVYFAVTLELDKFRRNDHANFYCPNGHTMFYVKPVEKTESEVVMENKAFAEENSQLKEEINQLKARLELAEFKGA